MCISYRVHCTLYIQICNADDSIQTFVVQDKINEPQLPYISCKRQTAMIYTKKNHPLHSCFNQYQASSAVSCCTRVSASTSSAVVSGSVVGLDMYMCDMPRVGLDMYMCDMPRVGLDMYMCDMPRVGLDMYMCDMPRVGLDMYKCMQY